MEFAGREFIYLPQKKIDKLNGYRSGEKKEKEEENVAPLPQINLEKKSLEIKEEEKEAPLPPQLIPKEESKSNQEKENLNKILDDKKEIEIEEISCDSNSCCNVSNQHLNDKYSNNGSYIDNCSCDDFVDESYEKEVKEENYVQETDLNIFSVDYNQILNKDFSLK